MKPLADLPLDQLTPLELFTRISVCLLLADGRMDFEERETWAESLTILFPDHNPDHAFEILQGTTQYLSNLSEEKRLTHALDCARQMKTFYSSQELRDTVYPQLEAMAESDGLLMSSEDHFLNQIQTVFNTA